MSAERLMVAGAVFCALHHFVFKQSTPMSQIWKLSLRMLRRLAQELTNSRNVGEASPGPPRLLQAGDCSLQQVLARPGAPEAVSVGESPPGERLSISEPLAQPQPKSFTECCAALPPRSQGLLLGVEDNAGARERPWSPTRSPPVLRGRDVPGPPGSRWLQAGGLLSPGLHSQDFLHGWGRDYSSDTGVCFSSRGIY